AGPPQSSLIQEPSIPDDPASVRHRQGPRGLPADRSTARPECPLRCGPGPASEAEGWDRQLRTDNRQLRLAPLAPDVHFRAGGDVVRLLVRVVLGLVVVLVLGVR